MDPHKTAIFSVIVPLYNKAAYVKATIDSVLQQSMANVEIIVVDDGSTDNSLEIVRAIHDPRLKIVEQRNSGVSVARNTGIAQATGTYICFLDADDVWSPDHLSLVSALIAEDPSAIAWATSYTEFTQLPDTGTTRPAHGTPAADTINAAEFYTLWSRYPMLWTGSITVRKSVLDALQPCFPPNESLGEDQDLWFRLIEMGHFCFTAHQETAFYRRNVNESLSSASVLSPLPAYMRLRSRTHPHHAYFGAVQHLFHLHLLHVAWSNVLAGHRKTALHYLSQTPVGFKLTYQARVLLACLLPIPIIKYARLSWQRMNKHLL